MISNPLTRDMAWEIGKYNVVQHPKRTFGRMAGRLVVGMGTSALIGAVYGGVPGAVLSLTIFTFAQAGMVFNASEIPIEYIENNVQIYNEKNNQNNFNSLNIRP
jgi:hypothetical protein